MTVFSHLPAQQKLFFNPNFLKALVRTAGFQAEYLNFGEDTFVKTDYAIS